MNGNLYALSVIATALFTASIGIAILQSIGRRRVHSHHSEATARSVSACHLLEQTKGRQ